MARGAKFTGGVVEYAGANTPGWISNLGITYAAGVLTITDAQGTALNAYSSNQQNHGWVTVPSTTAGQYVTLKVTSGGTFNDDAHASSSLTNLGFGITETVDWGSDMPFFLYVVNRANSDIDGTDGNSAFFISRDPRMSTTPSSGDDIGDTGAIPVNDSKDVILIMDDVTVANYTSLPCQLIGAFRMQWSTATDDWTVQALGNTDGVGSTKLDKTFATIWDFPLGQMGADSNSHLYDSGASGPTWATPGSVIYRYTLCGDGMSHCTYTTALAGNVTNGGGATILSLSLPITPNGLFYGTNPCAQFVGYAVIASTNEIFVIFLDGDNALAQCGVFNNGGGSANLLANDFSNSGDDLEAIFSYKAF